ncbi:MAG: PHP domain-containing protein [Marinovum sp.]|mgnify:FL=1|nr:PHP domain-containing protein [Marinovum sp.]MBT6531424.1 PHP domain-containing protein [Marinovum sp.]MBT7907626.1 PHP domain-containing protein [Marinovum sp.]MDG2231508.1 CehA/McbA family metallohydrolase [Paracoccaceae bacterium]
MIPEVFQIDGKFWRGNLHTHSNLSDGLLDPSEVCRRYQAEGYDFLALTDHFVGLFDYPIADTASYRNDRFTTILGAELHSGAMQNGELWHILAVGLPRKFDQSNSPHFLPIADQESGPEIAERARDVGAFVAIAHPQWSGMTLADARSIESAHAVEIYNHGCAVGCDRPDGTAILDLLLAEGRQLTAIATDDAHFKEPDHFGGWVMVKAKENTPDALLKALKNGHFYSSEGPELHHIELDKKELTVRSSSVSTVIVQAKGSATVAVHGSSITQTKIKLGRVSQSEWLRVTVKDSAGKRAWSNPIWR